LVVALPVSPGTFYLCCCYALITLDARCVTFTLLRCCVTFVVALRCTLVYVYVLRLFVVVDVGRYVIDRSYVLRCLIYVYVWLLILFCCYAFTFCCCRRCWLITLPLLLLLRYVYVVVVVTFTLRFVVVVVVFDCTLRLIDLRLLILIVDFVVDVPLLLRSFTLLFCWIRLVVRCGLHFYVVVTHLLICSLLRCLLLDCGFGRVGLFRLRCYVIYVVDCVTLLLLFVVVYALLLFCVV